MKRLLILLELLCAMTQATFAKKEGVFMEYNRKSIPEKNTSVNRIPMSQPIEVTYDTDIHKIEVKGSETMEAEVFLYDINGNLINSSSSLNTNFEITASGTYIIEIHGYEWDAEGVFEVDE